jgi:lysylphosphatidylglycerol synthetase-like protein (DUF2156 family)
MTTDDQRRGLTEPLESVTTFFGALMIIAALIGVAFLVIGSGGTYGGLPGAVCVTNPGTEYGGDWHTSAVTARPGHSINIIGSLEVCADHATLGEQTLNVVAALTAVVFWGGVLFLLWQMMVTARRNGPFTVRVATAMRRLGWFIIGSTTAAVVHLIAIDTLLTVMTKITNPFPNLLLLPLHLPIPILTGAALLTFARIVTAGAAMDAEIQATI